jgi:uncharacterized protein YchJ
MTLEKAEQDTMAYVRAISYARYEAYLLHRELERETDEVSQIFLRIKRNEMLAAAKELDAQFKARLEELRARGKRRAQLADKLQREYHRWNAMD